MLLVVDGDTWSLRKRFCHGPKINFKNHNFSKGCGNVCRKQHKKFSQFLKLSKILKKNPVRSKKF